MLKDKTTIFTWSFNAITALVIFILAVTVSIMIGYSIGVTQGESNTNQNTPNQTQLTQVEDLTADWQTYNNGIFNFSLKYPTDWTLKDELQLTGNGTDDQTLTLTRSIDDTSITLSINNQTPTTTNSPDIHSINYENNELKISKDGSAGISTDNPIISQYSGQINGTRYLFTTSSITNPDTLVLIEHIISTLRVNS